MTNTPSPLIAYNGKCPLCRAQAANRYIKSKSYRVAASSPDHRPIEIEWQNPGFAGINPLHYFVWFCPSCYYADTEEAFRKPDTLDNADLLREKFDTERADAGGVFARLGSSLKLGGDGIANHQALNLHLLAAAAHELLSPSRRNGEKLGRLYLRISWLYFEADPLAPAWALNHAMAQSVAVSWPRLPLTENAAVRLSIESYRTQFDRGGVNASSKKDLAMLLLLGRLHERIGELDQAADYCRVIFETAMAARQGAAGGPATAADTAFVARALDGLQVFKQNVERQILDRDREHIDAVVAKARQAPLEELIDELKDRGAHRITQQKLRDMLKAAHGGEAYDEDEARSSGGLWDRIRQLFTGGAGAS